MTGWRRVLVTAVAAPALAVSAGCGGEPVAAPDAAPSSVAPPAPVPELQPGAPGEDTTTRDPGAPLEEDPTSEDDVAFVQMMVLHHRQALEMSAMAEDDGSDQVRRAAARIEASQSAEILVLAQWLTEHRIDVPAVDADPAEYDHAQHGHAGMEGMLTGDELEELDEAVGTTLDRLFLAGMIRHHEGAIAMASYVLGGAGTDARVAEIATDVVADQSAEITRMRALLDAL